MNSGELRWLRLLKELGVVMNGIKTNKFAIEQVVQAYNLDISDRDFEILKLTEKILTK